tara:strand:- start:38080 stop:38604 length:525 start_codon:yes stop_codon:yes gene_type:complete
MNYGVKSRSILCKILYLCIASTFACQAEDANTAYVMDMNISGWQLHFDVSPGDLDQTKNLMIEFAQSFAMLDKTAMNKIIHKEFIWHLNTIGEGPNGKTLKGVDEVINLLTKRKETWRNVVYSDFKFFGTRDRIFQTYRVQGTIIGEGEFDVNGIDIYQITNEKIASKDSYWKR